ncbi:H-2 class I histocompatibility antigen, Q9 alpha chain-like [Petaurus breviceps papuanus]|uniref:H-2 class I histocompatibility antigen, Q9 alpha chain-like n=1 Tax=Petaurus breviceps papuanus TaxID=3040969 RepID=UPI0036DAE5CA
MAQTCLYLFWFLTICKPVLDVLAVSSGYPKLWYDLTAASYPELKKFSYMIHGYLNNRKFLSFDIKSQNVNLKSLEKEDIEYLIKKEKELEEILWVIDQNSDKKESSHTLQVILGCELQMNGYVRGFWNCRYNGQDFLSLSLENLTWTGVSPEAQEVKKILEKNKSQLDIQTYVLGHCPDYLSNYQRQNPEEIETAIPILHLPSSTTSGSMPIGTNSRAFTGIVTVISIIILAVVR